jgi:hypothetical protein
MSFHLVPMLSDRGVSMSIVVGIIALIGPMQVAGRVLLMASERRITAIQLGAIVYFAFPVAFAILALGANNASGLILFAVIYGIANGLITILRGMAVPAFIGPVSLRLQNGSADRVVEQVW